MRPFSDASQIQQSSALLRHRCEPVCVPTCTDNPPHLPPAGGMSDAVVQPPLTSDDVRRWWGQLQRSPEEQPCPHHGRFFCHYQGNELASTRTHGLAPQGDLVTQTAPRRPRPPLPRGHVCVWVPPRASVHAGDRAAGAGRC
jgi:hypothetical protein